MHGILVFTGFCLTHLLYCSVDGGLWMSNDTVVNQFSLSCAWLLWRQYRTSLYTSSICTQYPIMSKQKRVCILFEKCTTKYKHNYSEPLLWDTKLGSGASCFHWSSLICFHNLTGVPPVVNSIDLKWFGKAHACLFKVSQLTEQVRAKTKPWGRRNCL